MNKKFTVAILGVGARGFTYGSLMEKEENFNIPQLSMLDGKVLYFVL